MGWIWIWMLRPNTPRDKPKSTPQISQGRSSSPPTGNGPTAADS